MTKAYDAQSADQQSRRSDHTERTSSALQHKKSKGERVGTIPYGYDLGKDKMLVINEKEKEAIRMMMNLRSGHQMSYNKIAHWLDEQGIPTKKGASMWSGEVVRRIIKENTVEVAHRKTASLFEECLFW